MQHEERKVELFPRFTTGAIGQVNVVIEKGETLRQVAERVPAIWQLRPVSVPLRLAFENKRKSSALALSLYKPVASRSFL